MVDLVGVKPAEQVLCRPFAKERTGGIRALQPEEELPLQTRCRCSGPSHNGQPQVAGPASPHQTHICCVNPADTGVRGRGKESDKVNVYSQREEVTDEIHAFRVAYGAGVPGGP